MHELSLVMNIIGIAEEQVQKHHAQEVERIELEIGKLAGVEPEAFDFAWHSAIKDTVLGRAQLEIITVEAKARCPECRRVFTVKDRFQVCPKCHDYLTDFVQGMEFKVKSLTLC